MKTKEYIKPETTVLELDTEVKILESSTAILSLSDDEDDDDGGFRH